MSDFKHILEYCRKRSGMVPEGKLSKILRNDDIRTLSFLTVDKPVKLVRTLRNIRCQISFCKLEEIINHPEYKCYSIPKRRGGTREIQAPAGLLKQVLRDINFFLQIYYANIKPGCVHGYVINNSQSTTKSCNIVANAQPHVNKRFVLNMDIKEFFPSITANRVYGMFMSEIFQYNQQMATALALLCTYRGKLPTGAPSSPIISNFICLDLDRELIAFCEKSGLTYTRYADDLTFSTDTKITTGMISGIRQIIKKCGFQVNENKCRLQSSHAQQKVTGLVVNEKVNIDRRFLKRIRAMLHDLNKNGLHEASRRHFGIKEEHDLPEKLLFRFLDRLKGYINFVKQVRGEDHLYQKMMEEYFGAGLFNYLADF